MKLINLLEPRRASLLERKTIIKNILLLFSAVCFLFSLVSAVNFIISFLSPFSIPYNVALCISIIAGIVIDVGQQQSLVQLSVDYFKDRIVEPFTLIVAVVFILLSGYSSIVGSSMREKHNLLEESRKDSTEQILATTLSQSAPIISEVVKTKKMSWTEHSRELESAKLKTEQAKVHQGNISLANKYLDIKKEKQERETSLLVESMQLGRWTLLVIQGAFIFFCIGVGYFQAIEESGNSDNTNVRNNKKGMSDNNKDNFPPYDDGPNQRTVVHGFLQGLLEMKERDETDIDSSETNANEKRFTLSNNGLHSKECPVCGDEFHQNHTRQKFCSLTCKNRHHNGKR